MCKGSTHPDRTLLRFQVPDRGGTQGAKKVFSPRAQKRVTQARIQGSASSGDISWLIQREQSW
jgi:hypothetical protein